MESPSIPEKYQSMRSITEAERQARYKIFDAMVDLALDGICSLPQAILAYKEEIGLA